MSLGSEVEGTMRASILLLLGFLMLPMTAQAEFMTGDALRRSCEEGYRGDSSQAGKLVTCLAYPVGVFDLAESLELVCSPPNLTSDELRGITKRALSDRSENRRQSAAALIFKALVDQWPCPRDRSRP